MNTPLTPDTGTDNGSDSQLVALRQKIDAIDTAVLGLINRRMTLACGIGGCKSRNGAPVHDPQRERQILDRLAAINAGPLSNANLARIFTAIMAAARDVQQKAEVAAQVKRI